MWVTVTNRRRIFASPSTSPTAPSRFTCPSVRRRVASRYVLADNFFHAAFGGSFLNHFWLVCACTPRYDDAPGKLVAEEDAWGNMLRDGAITPRGEAVNDIEPRQSPHTPGADPRALLPPQTMPTIGDRLSEKGITWAWFADRSEEHTSELQSHSDLVCRLLLEKKKSKRTS